MLGSVVISNQPLRKVYAINFSKFVYVVGCGRKKTSKYYKRV